MTASKNLSSIKLNVLVKEFNDILNAETFLLLRKSDGISENDIHERWRATSINLPRRLADLARQIPDKKTEVH